VPHRFANKNGGNLSWATAARESDMSTANPTTPSKPKWRDIYKVYPAADVFPIMSESELKELAEDIKKNRLLVRIQIWQDADGDEYVIDGRNRLDAMELAGIDIWDRQRHDRLTLDPRYIMRRSAEDIVSRVIALNIKRRHLDAAQRAYLVAAAYEADEKFRAGKTGKHFPVSKGGRGQKSDAKKIAEDAGVSKPTAQTQLEVRRDPELKEKVETKQITPADAGRTIRERKKATATPQFKVETVTQRETFNVGEIVTPKIEKKPAKPPTKYEPPTIEAAPLKRDADGVLKEKGVRLGWELGGKKYTDPVELIMEMVINRTHLDLGQLHRLIARLHSHLDHLENPYGPRPAVGEWRIKQSKADSKWDLIQPDGKTYEVYDSKETAEAALTEKKKATVQ
jgi:hypothetical protein